MINMVISYIDFPALLTTTVLCSTTPHNWDGMTVRVKNINSFKHAETGCAGLWQILKNIHQYLDKELETSKHLSLYKKV